MFEDTNAKMLHMPSQGTQYPVASGDLSQTSEGTIADDSSFSHLPLL